MLELFFLGSSLLMTVVVMVTVVTVVVVVMVEVMVMVVLMVEVMAMVVVMVACQMLQLSHPTRKLLANGISFRSRTTRYHVESRSRR